MAPDQMIPPPFPVDRLIVRRRPGPVLELVGDLDPHSVPILETAVLALLCGRPRTVVVDTSAVTFVDSSGLRSFAECGRLLAADGGRLKIRRPPRALARLLQITGLDEVVEVDAA